MRHSPCEQNGGQAVPVLDGHSSFLKGEKRLGASKRMNGDSYVMKQYTLEDVRV